MPWEMKLLYWICDLSVSGEIHLYAMAQTKHPCFAPVSNPVTLESLHGLSAAVEQIHGVQHGLLPVAHPFLKVCLQERHRNICLLQTTEHLRSGS